MATVPKIILTPVKKGLDNGVDSDLSKTQIIQSPSENNDIDGIETNINVK